MSAYPSQTALKDLQNYGQLLYALCIHDIKSRFFGNGLGQILMILWPLCHIILLLTIYTVTGRSTPYGESIVLYSTVGLIPFIIFSYMSRFIMLAVLQNRAFLQYPIVRLLDLMMARAVLELMSAFIITFLLVVALSLLGDGGLPIDYAAAASAWGASIFLAFALGILNGAITAIFQMWNICFVLMIIVIYATSGILFVVSDLPEPIRDALSWNPVLQTVEWMRTAYYIDYNSLVLDKRYVLRFAFICLAAGLILERYTRRFRTA